SGAAIRAPLFRKLAQLLLGQSFLVPEQPPDLDQDGEIAGGENIAAPFGEQQIDLRRPAADALDPGEERDRLLIVGGKLVEVELARKDQLGEAADVARLLARDAGRAQLLVAGGEQQRQLRRGAERGLDLGPHRPRGGDADLLPDDRPQQRVSAGRAGAWLWDAMLLDDLGESRLARRQRLRI